MEQLVQRAEQPRTPNGRNLEKKEQCAFCVVTVLRKQKLNGDRFIPSRHVVTRPNPGEFKARWCLRSYLDPDVMELVGSGSTQSPTVSQLGRMLSCQMIVSNGWNSQLGDIRGAFLEADALDRKR